MQASSSALSSSAVVPRALHENVLQRMAQRGCWPWLVSQSVDYLSAKNALLSDVTSSQVVQRELQDKEGLKAQVKAYDASKFSGLRQTLVSTGRFNVSYVYQLVCYLLVNMATTWPTTQLATMRCTVWVDGGGTLQISCMRKQPQLQVKFLHHEERLLLVSPCHVGALGAILTHFQRTDQWLCCFLWLLQQLTTEKPLSKSDFVDRYIRMASKFLAKLAHIAGMTKTEATQFAETCNIQEEISTCLLTTWNTNITDRISLQYNIHAEQTCTAKKVLDKLDSWFADDMAGQLYQSPFAAIASQPFQD